ncbi:glucosamine-6-phosphate deaminase [Lachnoclostridium sp. Marseille-P6806]|uniref:glucosamine-6-phosphate deaminase n=1 Tax=Lachnoclostridium sp. Marseille-P6806 TaxID=2364793 RepID=UPI00102F38B3|nr:glucosamine-6-phosphate deaminase [Lachnoclostridium sp. Marseille-P6806]
MRIIRGKNYDEISRKAAELLAAQVVLKPDCVLGLATGSTPIGLYQYLAKWYEQGDLDFSAVTTVNLDEYCGLSPEHDQSYRYFMNENLFRHINIRRECTFVPDGLAADAEAACRAYDETVRRTGGVDIQLLGIGNNGHIGFNEPAETFADGTHIVKLTDSTIEANKRFFASREEVPGEAITMGVGTIMRAKMVVLVASGRAKAEAICNSFFGPVTPAVPASVLQLHPNVVVVCDEEALSLTDVK